MIAVIEIEQPVAVRPFDSGSQYVDWTDCNCDRCAKSTYSDAKMPCDLEYALLAACFGDGKVTPETALRCGLTANERRYVWQCNEVEWTLEWIAEYQRRHPEKFA
jgi:hypothetical protein